MSPYRSASQRRKSVADSSHQHCGVWQPYSLPMCHISSAGWSAYRAASRSTRRVAYARYTALDGQ